MLNRIPYIYAALLLLLSTAGSAQKVDPDRGAKLGNSYSISDIETINTTNGNLSLSFPLGSLPAGRASASAGIYLTYNSKLYSQRSEKRPDYRYFDGFYNRTILAKDNKGGWTLNSGYRLDFDNRPMDGVQCSTNADANQQLLYSKKLKVVFPDGSSHEMVPYYHKDVLNDRYFNIDINGRVESCTGSATYVSRPVYYSLDGSFLRLETTSSTAWTLYFPDGSRVVNGTRIYDRNGNYVDVSSTSVTDQFGRSAVIGSNSVGTTVTTKGVGGADIVWQIKWKTIAVVKTYKGCPDDLSCPASEFPLSDKRDNLQESFTVVDKIYQPSQLGGGEYTFSYNGTTYTTTFPTSQSNGWGELSGIEMPSGAKVTYSYNMDGQDGPVLFGDDAILKNYPTSKTLKYDLEYDGQVVDDGAVETWTYSVGSTGGSVTGPDGGTTTTEFGTTQPDSGGGLPWNTGLALKTTSPNGTKVENIWDRNIPAECTSSSTCANAHPDNPYIKTEFTSIKDASGSYTLTSAKDFIYDKNGNVTETKEYDWMPYSSVPRTDGLPTDLPSNAASYLKRISKTEFYNDVPTATSTSYTDADAYQLTSSPRLLRLAKSAEVLDSSSTPKSRSEMTYDYTNYASSNTIGGNLTESKVWDSFKGGQARSHSNPLTTTNSISTSVTYNSYGMPLTATDANGNVTQITYGNVSCASGNVTDLYPTQTISAYNTSVARTSSAVYDCYTGVVTTATDNDNSISTVTTFDALGRPTKVATASGTALESWTQTTYDDVNRRIVLKSDIEAKGDGRKVATQFFDQIGRVRLAKTLEDAATQSATNETDGIKVQTRYKFATGYTYQLTSNPYRAGTSGAETESTMGWTRSKAWSSGLHSEVETISGSGLPAPWGSNASSTGVVQTDIDANTTKITDQAGKVRRSVTNGLGQLERVDEPNSSNQLDVSGSPYQPTNYTYDVMNNLLTVTQASNTTAQCGGASSCSQTRTFTYSSLSRLRTAANPESGTVTYVYDNNGNLSSKLDARSITTAYVYDQQNRVTQRSYNDSPQTPTVNYYYDQKSHAYGKLNKVTSSISTTEYTTFDILGRVTGHKQTTDGTDYSTGYTYKLNGALDEETYPSGRVVKNVLDASGDLSIVESKKNSASGFWSYAKSFSYNAAGALTSMQLGNGSWESTAFNSRLQPTQIALGTLQTGVDKLKLNYGYGTTLNNGNVLTQDITVKRSGQSDLVFNQTYTYDEVNRLKIAEEKTGTTTNWKQTFTFDRYGNRRFDESNTTFPTSFTNGNLTNPTFNTSNNRMASGQNWTYDAAGNVTVDPDGRVFNYDGENKQTEVKNPSSVSVGTYYFDGDNKRVKKVVPASGETTVFVYDASSKQIAEYSTNVLSSQDAKVAYLTDDNLGTPRINTDANGIVTSRSDYMPYGEELTTQGGRSSMNKYIADSVRKGFTGYENDGESGLDYAFARMLRKDSGRFSGSDPYNIVLESGRETDPRAASKKLNDYLKMPSKWNRYVYCINNPLRYLDPSGEDVVVAFTGGFNGGGKATNDANDTTVKLVNGAREEAQKRRIEFDGQAIAPSYDVSSAVKAGYDFVKQNYRAGESLIIYGYSNGGDAAVELAEKLKADNINVNLVITIDASDGPLGNAKVNNVIPDNVSTNLNIYQTTSSGPSNSSSGSPSSFPGSHGGPNKAADPNKTNVQNNLVKNTTHSEIDEHYFDTSLQSIKNFLSH